MDIFKNWCENFMPDDNLQYTKPKPSQSSKIHCVVIENPTTNSNIDEFGEQPFACGPVFRASATVERRISREDGKDVYSLKLEAAELKNTEYEPGDAIGMLAENSENDVNVILNRVDDMDPDAFFAISNNDPKKKFLPKFSTLRFLLTNFLSLRFIPLKQFLLFLASNTENGREKTMLEYLCSKEGAETYRTVILESGTQFLNVISNFPSCRPSSNEWVGNLPRLLPRPYSIASSPLGDSFRVVLSVLPKEREGLCTGMVRRKLHDTPIMNCWIYFRKSHGFRLNKDDSAPMVLVGPGTGVAVFLGFLDHLYRSDDQKTVYLFTGFRYKSDMLFQEEFDKHLENRVLTKLFVSYSRESDSETKYIQESLQMQWRALGKLITENNAKIYECGDLKKMGNSVFDAFTQILQKYSETDKKEAAAILNNMKIEQRYLQDVWS